jgi:catechol 2,3-dioxygenase-like lactoylglutathione lyase family enzyme
VVDAVRHGLGNAEIARRRGVSADAVKFHLVNALGKLGLKTRRELRAWTGVRRDSHLHYKGPSMAEPLKLGPLGQIARTVTNLDAATAWHRDVLGLTYLFTAGTMAFFDCGGVRLLLQQGAAGPESIFYFRVEDIRDAHQQLLARGAAFDSAPHLIHRHPDGGTEEWMAFFRDPDDRILAIVSQVRPG